MMLTNFVPYDFYQNQVLYFSTSEEMYKLTLPSAVRLIPIFFYFIIYKTFPCLTLTNISQDLTQEYICATNAVANTQLFYISFNFSHFFLLIKL